MIQYFEVFTPVADMIWPSAFVVNRLFAWWVISAGLLVELFFVRYVTKLNWKMCVVADVCMNAASSTIGVILILLAGVGWELGPAYLVYPLLHVGTFNPFTWTVTFIFSVLINGAVESSVLKYAFRQKIGRKGFWIICLANAVSVGMVYCTFINDPPK